MHANLKSVQLRHMSGQVFKQIAKDVDDKIAKIPVSADAIGSIVDHKMSNIESLGVKDLTVNAKMNASSLDVGGQTLVVDATNESLDLGGQSLLIHPHGGSTFNTKLTSKAELLANDMFAFDRSTTLGTEHVVVMDKDRIQFNDTVGIASGGLDVTGGDASFNSDVKVVGTLKATGSLDSTTHTTTSGSTTTPTMTFSQGSIEMHKPITQSGGLANQPLELRSNDARSSVKVSDSGVKIDYPSGASEISVEYTGVTVSGGYSKNTTVFGNLYVNPSVYDSAGALGNAVSGKIECTGVAIKPDNDIPRALESSIGMYQSKYKASIANPLFFYNGVEELNPISENIGNTHLATTYKLHDKLDDNSDIWETTQFLSKRLLAVNDTLLIKYVTSTSSSLKS